MFPFKMIGATAEFLFKRRVLTSHEGAEWASKREIEKFLSSRNRGLLLDGDSLRLSEEESFQNVCVIARVGAGKTSQYIIPNVLDKARSNCSLVVNDPKGEIYEKTAATMAANGYRLIVIDPENPNGSNCFNPLAEARNGVELEQIAEIIIKAGLPSDKDPFWSLGAIRLVTALLKCLNNAGKENPAYFNLANLTALLQNFGKAGEALQAFAVKYSVDPDDPNDWTLWKEWQGALSGNEQGVQSFVLNALTALRITTNPNVARITARSDFDLSEIRQKKTVIYFITPPQLMGYYAPLISMFFRSVFNACMRQLPAKGALPVYILYDEFGHSVIPHFSAVANTLRGYKASLSIVLQSVAQLEARYQKADAAAILGGFNTLVAYSASDPQTAAFFSQIIGKIRERVREDYTSLHEHIHEHELMLSNEVRTIAENEAIIVSRNRNPIKTRTVRYFENRTFARAATKKPTALPSRPLPPVELVKY